MMVIEEWLKELTEETTFDNTDVLIPDSLESPKRLKKGAHQMTLSMLSTLVTSIPCLDYYSSCPQRKGLTSARANQESRGDKAWWTFLEKSLHTIIHTPR